MGAATRITVLDQVDDDGTSAIYTSCTAEAGSQLGIEALWLSDQP